MIRVNLYEQLRGSRPRGLPRWASWLAMAGSLVVGVTLFLVAASLALILIPVVAIAGAIAVWRLQGQAEGGRLRPARPLPAAGAAGGPRRDHRRGIPHHRTRRAAAALKRPRLRRAGASAATPTAAQAMSVGIIPILKRSIATMAAAESSAARQSSEARTGQSGDRPRKLDARDLPEDHMQPEPERKVHDDADDGGGDRAQRRRERLVAAQRLDIGRTEEDPEEAGREGHPQRQQRAEAARQQRRQAARRRGSRPGSRRTAAPGSAARASSRRGRGRRSSRPAAASHGSRPPPARHRRAPHRRRRR